MSFLKPSFANLLNLHLVSLSGLNRVWVSGQDPDLVVNFIFTLTDIASDLPFCLFDFKIVVTLDLLK